MNADTCRNIEPIAFRAFQRGQGAGGGDLIGMVFRAGHFQHRNITIKPHAFRQRADIRQAAQGCKFAFRGDAALGQARFLNMANHQCAEAAGVGQGAAIDLGVFDNPHAIAKRNSARVLQETNLGHFLAGTPLGQGGHRQDIDGRVICRAAQQKFERFRRINWLGGIGSRHDGRHAACGCCLSCGAETFFVAFARFPDPYPHIDNARRKALTAAINGLVCLGGVIFAGGRNHAIGHSQPSGVIGQGDRINQSGVFEN